jgi:hypothetical protein
MVKTSLTATNAVLESKLEKHFQEEYRQQRRSEMSYILTFVGRYSRVLAVTSISSRLSTKRADRVRWLSCHEKGTSKRHSRRSRLDSRSRTTLSSRETDSDRGGEYESLREYLNEEGIILEMTAAYCPESNGSAERFNRSILDKAKSMLSHAKLDHEFWGEAVNYANYVRERVPTRTSDGEFSTPYERRTGDKPGVRHIKVFGCKCLVHVPHQKRKKLDQHAWAGILLGIEGYDTYRVYDPRSGKVEIVRNVQFDESEFPREGQEPDKSNNGSDVSMEDSGSRGMPDPVNSNSDDDSESYGEDGDDSESYGENSDNSESYGENADDEDSQGDISTEIRRPKRQRRPPKGVRLAQTSL